MLREAAFRTAPMKKLMEPTTILALLPLFFVMEDAANVEINAAKYKMR